MARLSEAVAARIVALSNSGLGTGEVARAARVSPATVRRVLHPEVRARNDACRRRSRPPTVAPVRTGVAWSTIPLDALRQLLLYKKVCPDALYDPDRDGAPRYERGALTGDPPVGRREMLARWSEENP